MNIEIANRLVELRKKSGLSQEELAARLGLSRQAVSKWERAEASPDTDNLICLAKLYGVSLDDLLNTNESVEEIVKEQVKPESDGAKPADSTVKPSVDATAKTTASSAQSTPGATDAKPQDTASSSTTADTSKATDPNGPKGPTKGSVHIGVDGIHVRDKDGSYVDIDTSGIHLNDKPFGFHVTGSEVKEAKRSHAYKVASAIVGGTLGILAIAAFFLLGFLWTENAMGWKVGWLVFFIIPLGTSFVEALRKKRFCTFAFPVLVAGVYLLLGMMWGLWHPEWVMFFAIPVYYTIFEPIDHLIREKSFDSHGININVFGKDDDDDDDDKDDDKDDDDDSKKDDKDKVIDVDVK